MPGFGTGSVLATIVAVIFYGAIIYAVMRTFWAIWEIPDRLQDIERRLESLGEDVRKLNLGETTEKEHEG